MGKQQLGVGSVCAAWDLIGAAGTFRLWPNGNATYEQVDFHDSTPGTQVKLSRLVAEDAGLRCVERYVDPDTLIQVMELTA